MVSLQFKPGKCAALWGEHPTPDLMNPALTRQAGFGQPTPAEGNRKHSTSNIQHPTFK
jgi:hypothetical protein